MSESQLKRSIISVLTASLLVFYYIKIAYSDDIIALISKYIGNYNIFLYILGIGFFIGVVFIIYYINFVYHFLYEYGMVLGVILLLGTLWTNMYMNLGNILLFSTSYPFYAINKWYLCALIAVGSAAMLILIYIQERRGRFKNIIIGLKWAVYVVIALVVVWTIYVSFCIGISNYYQLVHTDAIFSPIYHAFYNEPYSNHSYGIYGHYAIILYPLFKLIGLSTTTFAICMTGIAVISLLMVIYCIVKAITNIGLRIFTIIALLFFGGNMVYVSYQGYVRMFFSVIMMTLLVFIVEKRLNKNKLTVCITYVVAMLAIIWNTETGIVVAITCMAFWVYQENISIGIGRKFFITILKHGIYVITVFGAAVGVVSLWNVAQGGKVLNLNLFLLPLTNSKYMIESLQLALDNFNCPWKHIFALCLIFVACGIVFILARNKTGLVSCKVGLYCAIAVLTLGNMTYFINRPAAGNLFLVHYESMLLLAILADRCLIYGKKAKNICIKSLLRGCGISFALLITYLAIFTIINIIGTQEERKTVKLDKFYEDKVQSIAENVPPNTPAIGKGVDLFFSTLGWDTGYHLPDTFGYTQEPINILENALQKCNTELFLDISSVRILFAAGYCEDNLEEVIRNNYNIAWKFEFCDYEWWYIQPK